MATDPSAETPSAFWERFYEDRDRWSGRPNPALVDEASDLPRGRALDLQATTTGADVDRLVRRRALVDDRRQSPTAAARAARVAGVARPAIGPGYAPSQPIVGQVTNDRPGRRSG